MKEAVESVFAQTYPSVEIVISQNPHKDPSVTRAIAGYCRNLAARDSRVRHQIHPKDVGPPANFNSVVDAARGEYLAFIGDDDRLLPNAIETMAAKVDSDTTMVFANHYFIDANGSRSERERAEWTSFYCRDRIPAGKVENPEICAWQQAPAIAAALIRTADFRRIRFREDIDVPDTEFFIRLAREAGSFVFVPEYVSETRSHDDSTTAGGFRGHPGLVDNLQRLAVSPEVEPHKRRLLELLTVSAVSTCLLDGDLSRARRLLDSVYYPDGARSGAKGLVMKVCAGLPGNLGTASYRFLHALKRGRLPEPLVR